MKEKYHVILNSAMCLLYFEAFFMTEADETMTIKISLSSPALSFYWMFFLIEQSYFPADSEVPMRKYWIKQPLMLSLWKFT